MVSCSRSVVDGGSSPSDFILFVDGSSVTYDSLLRRVKRPLNEDVKLPPLDPPPPPPLPCRLLSRRSPDVCLLISPVTAFTDTAPIGWWWAAFFPPPPPLPVPYRDTFDKGSCEEMNAGTFVDDVDDDDSVVFDNGEEEDKEFLVREEEERGGEDGGEVELKASCLLSATATTAAAILVSGFSLDDEEEEEEEEEEILTRPPPPPPPPPPLVNR